MSNVHGITVDNLLSTFPDYLRKDETIMALAESIAEKFGALPELVDGIRIYAMINELPNELLDILAYDFKVDWWDPNYTIEQKRQTLKDSWDVHRTLGTKHAVVTAISAIYPYTEILEWFEYNGPPFEFRILIDSTHEGYSPTLHKRVLERLEYYKNLRSTPYQIEYTAHPHGDTTMYAGAAMLCIAAEITVEVKIGEMPPPLSGEPKALFDSTGAALYDANNYRLNVLEV